MKACQAFLSVRLIFSSSSCCGSNCRTCGPVYMLPIVFWWRVPQQMLRTHRSLEAYCATLWWRWLVFSFYCVMEHRWNKNDRGKPKYSGENLFQCHLVHHKSHIHWLGIEPRLPRRQAGDLPPEPWHGLCNPLFCFIYVREHRTYITLAIMKKVSESRLVIQEVPREPLVVSRQPKVNGAANTAVWH
jgi:hypothetical protein